MFALGLAACTTRRAPAWESHAPELTTARASLVLLGDTAGGGRAAQTVARQVDDVLTRQPGAIVLWLGHHAARERCRPALRPGTRALREVVERHRRRGGASFAIPGPHEWRCGTTRAAGPWVVPATHYVVSLARDGTSEVTLRCDLDGCTATPPTRPVWLELVFLDWAPWLAPVPESDRTLAASARLLAELRRRDASHPPRILVGHAPVEAAGTHGVGGWSPDATFHALPPALQQALLDGMFVGAIGGRDGASYADDDIAPAVARSDKRWLPHGVFEVVSGAAAHPDARRGRGWRYGTSLAFLPDVYTPAPSFAMVLLGVESRALVFSRHHGRWHHAAIPLTLAPAPLGAERSLPPMAPCLRCPAVPASQRP